MNLFEDDNKNEAAPAQEPVSAKPAEKPKPTVTPAAKASKKPLNISDYAWIGGIAVIAPALVWLFGGSDSDTAPATGMGRSSLQRNVRAYSLPLQAGFW
ncbi:hypothetical protein [Klebsiella pneumoniae]|uniref:hypothetical protein n=1 Tax=Klebsiella pneumoniae TaxID=573 RepID=UPI001D1824E2|nr:hypothetical protein [Klebsiella pneumoniae]